jgi:hypothetical protein
MPLAVAACASLWLTSSAAADTPPFHQCPAAGNDTSCSVLVVINSNRTVSVYDDPTQRPYDGADDTLVGVQNNSPTSVRALTISGAPGSGIFGFDGDGLCGYLVGLSCGSTGYEGPSNTFTRDPSTYDSGEVDFQRQWACERRSNLLLPRRGAHVGRSHCPERRTRHPHPSPSPWDDI